LPSALLVSYGGYPFTPSSLTPDNGLASLAGALMGAGYDLQILDYGTVSNMRRLFPRELTELLRPAAAEMMAGSGQPSPEAMEKLHQADAALEQHQAEQVAAIAEEVAEEVRALKPDFVGFKLWSGDGFTGSVAIAEHLREQFPSLHLYAGGPQVSWFGETIYDRTQAFDALLHGEGEQAILALAEHAQGKRDLGTIPGVIFLEDGGLQRVPPTFTLEMDELPEPAYHEHVYPAMAGDEKIKVIVIDDSRGCPYQCGFCMHPIESGTRLRTASASVLVDRMARLIHGYGITAFRFSGSSTPGDLMAEVADEILERGLKVTYTCFGHFGSARPDDFERMAASGLYAIFFGIETGCRQVLERAVRKGMDLDTVEETVTAAQAAGIFVVASVIVPLPFDTEQTIRESLEFVLRARPDSVPVQFPGLIPGTPWWREADRYGFEFDADEYARVAPGYKIKLLFPPAYWDPAPYTLGGMSFAEFTALTAEFAAELERNGVLTGLPDDNALIARCAGMTPREFRDRGRLWCTIGDAEAMGEMVAQANANILRPGTGP
jgi:radical SAM superfamily enzyme YgiQ (UPF0313 family)